MGHSRETLSGWLIAGTLVAALLAGCERQEEEAPAGPGAPETPPTQGMQQPTESDTPGLPDADAVAREAEEAARRAAAEVEQAAEAARQEAEKQVAEAREEGERQVEEVSQAARETMEQYVSDLGALGETLGGVTNQFSAASAAPKVRTLVESLESSLTQLEAIAPEQLAALKSLYSDTLTPALEKVRGEVNRLTSSDSFAALRPLLQDLPLLQP